MKTQMVNQLSTTTFSNFQKIAIRKDQLLKIKGGDGETPPEDEGYIGMEEIVGG
ncbi:MAG: hypothetical protein R2824_31975 [Saprospiraceae bacterium]